MMWRAKALVILIGVAAAAGAQTTMEMHGPALGYWVDPATGLMWAAKDNGKDVSWRGATEYCTNLRLAGYSDWRLATVDELEGIYNPSARSPGRIPKVGKHEAFDYAFNVKGNIYLTGDPWSSSRIDDDRGLQPRFGWYRDFSQSGRTYDKLSYSSVLRALCVRGSTITPTSPLTAVTSARAQSLVIEHGDAQDTRVLAYWIDPATGLMWAGKDSFEDVSWHNAIQYCRDLQLAGYSDWRLANAAELGGIYDKSTESPGVNPRSHWHSAEPMNWHVKGNLLLTGDEWANNYREDDRGKNSGYAYYFDFNDGRSDNEPSGFPYSSAGMRALCVRGSEVH